MSSWTATVEIFGGGTASSHSLRIPWWVRVICVCIGALFVIAGFQKAVDPTQLREVFLFNGLRTAIPVLLAIVPLWEIVLGCGLMLNIGVRWFLRGLVVTLAVFTVQLAFLLTSAEAPDCGCIQLLDAATSSAWSNAVGVSRNVILMTLALCCLVALRQRARRSGQPTM